MLCGGVWVIAATALIVRQQFIQAVTHHQFSRMQTVKPSTHIASWLDQQNETWVSTEKCCVMRILTGRSQSVGDGQPVFRRKLARTGLLFLVYDGNVPICYLCDCPYEKLHDVQNQQTADDVRASFALGSCKTGRSRFLSWSALQCKPPLFRCTVVSA